MSFCKQDMYNKNSSFFLTCVILALWIFDFSLNSWKTVIVADIFSFSRNNSYKAMRKKTIWHFNIFTKKSMNSPAISTQFTFFKFSQNCTKLNAWTKWTSLTKWTNEKDKFFHELMANIKILTHFFLLKTKNKEIYQHQFFLLI